MTPELPPIELAAGTILGDEVYERIGNAILDGTLKPGQQLKDVELAAQLGISRTPVREALQRLERFGVVEVAVGRYTRVSIVDDALRADTAALIAYLIGDALHIALKRCTDEELAEIMRVADATVVAANERDTEKLSDLAVEVYSLIVRATNNRMLMGVIGEVSLAIRRNLPRWDPLTETPGQRAAAYRAFRDALLARDADAAERAVMILNGIR